MRPDPTTASLIEALSETAKLLIEMAREITDRAYTLDLARQDLEALETTGLHDALTAWIEAQS